MAEQAVDSAPSKHYADGQEPNELFKDAKIFPMENTPDLAHTLSKGDAGFFRRGSWYESTYGLLGLALGVLCVTVGLAIFLNGVAGSTSWTATAVGAGSEVSDPAPGSVLGILVLLIIYVTGYARKVKK